MLPRQNVNSTLLGCWLVLRIKWTWDRFTGEKHVHLFSLFYMTWRTILRNEERPREVAKSKCFSIGLKKERQLWKSNCSMWGGEEGWEFCWTRSVPPLILHSLSLTITISFSFQEREDIFHWGTERGQLGGEGTGRRGRGWGTVVGGWICHHLLPGRKKGRVSTLFLHLLLCCLGWRGGGCLFLLLGFFPFVLFFNVCSSNNILVYFTSKSYLVFYFWREESHIFLIWWDWSGGEG